MAFGRRRSSGDARRRVQLLEGQDDTSFRRSRTLQGTTSSNVKAANQKRAELKSDRLKKQQQDKRKKVITVFAGIVLLIVLGLWYLASQYILGVGSISFQPQSKKEPPMALYEKAISDYISARPGERFRFALNQERLAQTIASDLPEVKRITKEGAVANQANFKIELRQPIAGWKTSNGQSFVDNDGVSFMNNYFDEPSVAIVDNSGADIQNGTKAVVSERFLRFLGRLIAFTNTSGLGEVKEATLPKGTARQIDIKIEGKKYYIKTHIDRDPAATVEDIKRVVDYLDQKKVTPSYVDVRVAGRAFYK